ncbi:AAA family ATPase [Ensifer sp. NBAIM29]|nr:AAA family ATPase [Ensifer sp. NBAIM29]
MAVNFYFSSLKLENFRSFKSLNVEKFRRINIIGGFNGVGKSALLEAMFFILDRRNPVALIKPLLFRRYGTSASIDPLQFLKDRDTKSAQILWTGRSGRCRIAMAEESLPPNLVVSHDASTVDAALRVDSGTFSSQRGLAIRTYVGAAPAEDEGVFVMAAPNGMSGTIFKASESELPRGQFLSIAIRQEPKELAQIISTLIKRRRLTELVSHLQILHKDVQDLKTLQEGNEVQVYVQLNNDELLPMQYMGDGFQNLLHTLAAILNCPGGVIFLDEIDAAMHYSIVSDVWKVIAEIAARENCQIIATTHSRECINSAARGIEAAGKRNDFQYLRLERRDSAHGVVSYDMNELVNAEEYSVEIR